MNIIGERVESSRKLPESFLKAFLQLSTGVRWQTTTTTSDRHRQRRVWGDMLHLLSSIWWRGITRDFATSTSSDTRLGLTRLATRECSPWELLAIVCVASLDWVRRRIFQYKFDWKYFSLKRRPSLPGIPRCQQHSAESRSDRRGIRRRDSYLCGDVGPQQEFGSRRFLAQQWQIQTAGMWHAIGLCRRLLAWKELSILCRECLHEEWIFGFSLRKLGSLPRAKLLWRSCSDGRCNANVYTRSFLSRNRQRTG